MADPVPYVASTLLTSEEYVARMTDAVARVIVAVGKGTIGQEVSAELLEIAKKAALEEGGLRRLGVQAGRLAIATDAIQ